MAARLGRFVELSAGERDMLRAMEAQPRSVPRGTVLRRERDLAGHSWILESGWAVSAINLPDGSRQITRVHLPGDMLGSPSIALERAGETLTTLTQATVCVLPNSVLTVLFEEHQRLAGLFLMLSQIERMVLGDRIAAIGRTDARARVAGILLDLINRLRLIDPATGNVLPLQLTQEDIGDATGLTAVHVNRMMRLLADEGMIERQPGIVRLTDEAGLVRASGYINRWSAPDTSWLPAPRS